MNPHPTPLRNRSRSAFSLIEVVLALAVSALGLIAILGLLPQGLQASRDAADNTISAAIVHDIFSTLRTTPFTNLASNMDSLGFIPKLTGSSYTNLQAFPVTPPVYSISNYLDQVGFYTTPDLNGYYTNAYYKVTLTFQPEIAPNAPFGTLATVATVTATVVWPAHAASPINTKVFVTKVAQYKQ